MDAMILSAGLGLRMRPLTASTPKPLLRAGPLRLIEYHLHQLARCGFTHAVINTSYCADQFVALIGDGRAYGLRVSFSHEGPAPLETGGGIRSALALIQTDSFAVVSADVFTDFAFDCLRPPAHSDAHLILVANPPHHPDGDFVLNDDARLSRAAPEASQPCLTYSGIAVMRKQLFTRTVQDTFPLRTLFDQAIAAKRLSGEKYCGAWHDIGTVERLQHLNRLLMASERRSADRKTGQS